MMIAEGIIAMIWAAAAMSLFDGYGGLNEMLAAGGPAGIVSQASTAMLGAVGGTLAVLGVIVLPITSGDTAFRSARMIIADYFKYSQAKLTNRLWIALPLFVLSFALTKIDFTILWRYFSWANQSTAVIALWVGAMYLFIAKKNYWIAMIPGMFMTTAVTSYILNAQIGFGLSLTISNISALIVTAGITALFFSAAKKARAQNLPLEEDISFYNKTA